MAWMEVLSTSPSSRLMGASYAFSTISSRCLTLTSRGGVRFGRYFFVATPHTSPRDLDNHARSGSLLEESSVRRQQGRSRRPRPHAPPHSGAGSRRGSRLPEEGAPDGPPVPATPTRLMATRRSTPATTASGRASTLAHRSIERATSCRFDCGRGTGSRRKGSSLSFARHSWASESIPLRPSTGSTATRMRICG